MRMDVHVRASMCMGPASACLYIIRRNNEFRHTTIQNVNAYCIQRLSGCTTHVYFIVISNQLLTLQRACVAGAHIHV